MNRQLQDIQDKIDEFKTNNPDSSVGELSDGYHKFNELYKHRTILFASFINCIPFSYKTWKHPNNDVFPMFDGMFLVGAITPFGQISYHCDAKHWNDFRCMVLPHGPEFDGHTPDDVVDRINRITLSYNLSEESEKQRYISDTTDLAERYLEPIFEEEESPY